MRDQAGRVCRPGRAQRGPGGPVPAEPAAPPTAGAEAESRAPRGGRPPGEARPPAGGPTARFGPGPPRRRHVCGTQELLLPTEKQVREKRLSFPAG